MPEVYHSVVLLSKGAPIEHGRLNTTWERDAAEPEVNGFPHFTNAKGSLHLFRTAEGLWEIAPEIDAGKAFAVARTAAAHPNTIKPGEWSLPKGGGWAKASGFKVSTEGPNTEDVRRQPAATHASPRPRVPSAQRTHFPPCCIVRPAPTVPLATLVRTRLSRRRSAHST